MADGRPGLPAWAQGLALLLVAGTGLGYYAMAEWQGVGGWGFPLDDAWIHLQFARNLAAGDGLSFNAGEPSAGSTAPLWTLALALVTALQVNPVAGAKVVGALLLLGVGWLTLLLARAAGLRGHWPLAAGLITVATPRLLWASLSGMEVLLATVLVTAAAWRHLAALGGRLSTSAPLLLGAATLARPECVLLLPLMVAEDGHRRHWATGWWQPWVWRLVAFALLLGPWAWWNVHATGKPLPGTFYAKVGGYGLLGALADLDPARVARAVLLNPWLQARELAAFAVEDGVLLAVLLPFGLAAAWLPTGPAKVVPRPRLLVAAVLTYPLARGLLAPFQGALFQHGRYAAHLVPMLTVLALLGAAALWRDLQARGWPASPRWCRARWPAAWALLLALELAGLMARDGRNYGRDVADIENLHVAMGRWVEAHAPPGAVVAANDIGALAYFGHRRVLDLVGLVTPAALAWRVPGEPADRAVLRYIEQEHPAMLVLLPNWYPELSRRQDLFTPVHEVAVRGSAIAGGDRLVAYLTPWAAAHPPRRDP